jgi:hypothetical protein
MPPIARLPLLLLLTLSVGCDDKEQQLRTWQQEKVTQIQRHAQENAATTNALVASEAESRRQFLELEQDLQTQRNELEQDRQAVATARERVPLLAAALQGSSAVLLGILALGVTGYLLTRANSDDGAGELEETLLMELSSESVLFPPLPSAVSGPVAALTASDDIASSAPSSINPSGDVPCRTS